MNGGIKFFHLMLFFACGSFVSGFTKCDQEAIYQGRYSPNLLASAFAVVLGCFVHYCKSESGIANDDASECLFLWAFSQGIQNGITRRCSSLPVCTTHFTGYLTDFGVGLGLWARAQADGAEPPTLLKVFLFGSGIFFFGLGGVAAMETHPAWGAQGSDPSCHHGSRGWWPHPCDQAGCQERLVAHRCSDNDLGAPVHHPHGMPRQIFSQGGPPTSGNFKHTRP